MVVMVQAAQDEHRGEGHAYTQDENLALSVGELHGGACNGE